jgi:hypothetical protein
MLLMHWRGTFIQLAIVIGVVMLARGGGEKLQELGLLGLLTMGGGALVRAKTSGDTAGSPPSMPPPPNRTVGLTSTIVGLICIAFMMALFLR